MLGSPRHTSVHSINSARLQFCRLTDEPRYTPLVQLISILETAFSLFLSRMQISLSPSPFHSASTLLFLFFFSSFATYKQQALSVRLTTCTSSRCFIRRRPLSRPVSLNPCISVISLIGNRSCDLQCLARHTGN